MPVKQLDPVTTYNSNTTQSWNKPQKFIHPSSKRNLQNAEVFLTAGSVASSQLLAQSWARFTFCVEFHTLSHVLCVPATHSISIHLFIYTYSTFLTLLFTKGCKTKQYKISLEENVSNFKTIYYKNSFSINIYLFYIFSCVK